ncbi:MAG: hypothetical protein A2173_00280 [Planctomycetes bacterium RBG_13_44_8b]|nr:MAG: hypothetical protein A2173_00280 [Planctomycetes bacterium RBG_13_44_8b]
MRGEARFSYIEILVVVIVLVLVSVKAVPQLTQAGQDARIGRLIDGLQQMRSQLDLYKVQHGDNLPPADSYESFKNSLTTNTGKYGPYIKQIPVNTFNNLPTVRFDDQPAGAGLAGWRLDTKTGLFQADDSVIHAGL